MTMKTILVFLLVGAMALSFAACGNNSDPNRTPKEPDAGMMVGGDPAAWGPAEDPVGIPNPFTDYETLEEAVSAVGFGFVVPDAIQGHEISLIQVLGENSMIQAIYGEDEVDVLVRKAVGSDDISGDYNNYSQTGEKTVDGRTVTVKGENDRVMVALWTEGGYAYSIGVGDGMDPDSMTALIATIQ